MVLLLSNFILKQPSASIKPLNQLLLKLGVFRNVIEVLKNKLKRVNVFIVQILDSNIFFRIDKCSTLFTINIAIFGLYLGRTTLPNPNSL
jgi:hypothetical protein